MPSYLQAARYLTVTTSLGPDVLLLRGLKGREAISRPFVFHLDLVATNGTDIPFDRLLGQKVTAHMGLSEDQKRHFSGICSGVSEGHRDATFTYYRLEIVPQFWLLKLRSQSRIFQQISVPDVLKKVLEGLDVSYQIRGTFYPRDFCVQYGETDFAFVSRLMEEEGIYYFFRHSSDGHQMVLANTPQGHPPLDAPAPVEFETSEVGDRQGGRITSWRKRQALRPGQFTLRDHCFELPHDPLSASKTIPASVRAGQVEHRLRIGNSDRLEVYGYPGAYAQRFDGIDPGGGDRSGDLRWIYEDNGRTTEIRMQEGAVPGLVVAGAGHCHYLASGSKFTLSGHPNADGNYILLDVRHEAHLGGDYRSGMGVNVSYRNRFRCIPAEVTFRPPRVTPRPVVQGTQTAVVVGPPGEEIFTDKYGRVKVQFHWDREGKNDADSSCWVRVGSPWAGGQWGAIKIPRIGHEVIVAFEEGDPDRPIIIGSVYNAQNMPPYALPGGKVSSGFKSNSTPGGQGYNEFSFDDTKGQEKVTVHAQHDMNSTVEHDESHTVHNNRSIAVDGTHTETIKKDTAIQVTQGNFSHNIATGTALYHVKGAVTENYDATQATTVAGPVTQNYNATQATTVAGPVTQNYNATQATTVAGAVTQNYNATQATTVAGAVTENYNATQATTVKNDITITSVAGNIVVQAAESITLMTGSSLLHMSKDGTITLSGKTITILAASALDLSSPQIKIAGGQQAVMGVGSQCVQCNMTGVTVTGNTITSSAQATHTITGGMVKIN